jgi:hypothetical protein
MHRIATAISGLVFVTAAFFAAALAAFARRYLRRRFDAVGRENVDGLTVAELGARPGHRRRAAVVALVGLSATVLTVAAAGATTASASTPAPPIPSAQVANTETNSVTPIDFATGKAGTSTPLGSGAPALTGTLAPNRAATLPLGLAGRAFPPASAGSYRPSTGLGSPSAAAPGPPVADGGWSVVSSPNPEVNNYMNGVACPSSTDCEAVGDYYNSSGVQVTLAEGWNGTTWALQTIPNPTGATNSSLSGVACSSSTECEAVGGYTNNAGVGVTLAEGWNGTRWALQTTPNPTGATDTSLSAVACLSSTECEAVGGYTNSAGVGVTLTEAWNGTKWAPQASPNPTGAGGSSLSAVACPSSTDCEAVGSYENSSGDYATLAEGWNGTTWALQASRNPTGATFSFLYGVACLSSTDCEAVGEAYTNSSGQVTLAERWNGTKWALQAIANPTGSDDSSLTGVACSSSTDCAAVGYYNTTSSGQVALAERWNGTKWALQAVAAGGGAGGLNGVACSSSTECEAVGSYYNSFGYAALAEGWNGTQWALQASPNPGADTSYQQGVTCSSSTDCEAVGSYYNSSGVYVPFAEGWNGTTWALQAVPTPAGATASGLSAVACSSSTDCEAVGNYLNGSGSETLAADWNGTTWALQAIPNPTGATYSYLYGVACPSSTDCEAVGGNMYGAGTGYVALAEQWNGTTWAPQTMPWVTGSSDIFLNAVACASSADCEAVGGYYNGSNVGVTLAEDWNGTTWAPQATPNPTGATYSDLTGVACPSPTDCEAVGSYYNSSGVLVSLAEGLNATTWALQASPNPTVGGELTGVACPSPTDCEAVGFYPPAEPGGNLAPVAEGWNGTTWALQATPNPTDATGSNLNGVACPSSTDCEAVGDYTNSSSQPTLVEAWSPPLTTAP